MVIVSGRTHVVLLFWLPEANLLGCETDNVAIVVDDTGTRTPGADIDADIVTFLDLHRGRNGKNWVVRRRREEEVRFVRKELYLVPAVEAYLWRGPGTSVLQ